MFARMRAREAALDAREAVNAASFERLSYPFPFRVPPLLVMIGRCPSDRIPVEGEPRAAAMFTPRRDAATPATPARARTRTARPRSTPLRMS